MFLLSPSWTLSAGQKGPGVHFLVVVQSLSHVRLIVTPWTAARQAQRPLWPSRIVIWKIFNRWCRLSLSNASTFPQVPERSVLALPLPSPLHPGVCMVSQSCPTHLFSRCLCSQAAHDSSHVTEESRMTSHSIQHPSTIVCSYTNEAQPS